MRGNARPHTFHTSISKNQNGVRRGGHSDASGLILSPGDLKLTGELKKPMLGSQWEVPRCKSP